jgi:hypothetical protein
MNGPEEPSQLKTLSYILDEVVRYDLYYSLTYFLKWLKPAQVHTTLCLIFIK